MDTFKDGTYSDTPDNLEKGCPAAQPLHSEACPAYSAQPERTRRRSISIFKFAFGAVTLIWLLNSYGLRVFGRRHVSVCSHCAWFPQRYN
jgi:hypothetical protein